MLSFLLALQLVSSPYPFEVDQGVVLEAFLGGTIADRDDKEGGVGGLRLSYINPDEADAVATAELEYTGKIFPHGFDKRPDQAHTFKISLLFYEFYHPFAFRVAGGPGVELRKNTFNPMGAYRGGVGYYFTKHFAGFADVEGEVIFRERSPVLPIALTLSTQIVF